MTIKNQQNNMAKKQKIWLAVFLAMFLVPEILWSPIGNFLYNMVRFIFGLGEGRVFYGLLSFPDSSESSVFLIICLLIQILGLSGTLSFVLRMSIKRLVKYLLLILLIVLIISNLFFLVFVVNFNPRIG